MICIRAMISPETNVSGVVVLDPSHRVLERAAAVQSVMRLKARPTLLFVNRCGINHPRMAGLASHLGVILDMPTIGVSKSVLCGSFSPQDQVDDASSTRFASRPRSIFFRSVPGP